MHGKDAERRSGVLCVHGDGETAARPGPRFVAFGDASPKGRIALQCAHTARDACRELWRPPPGAGQRSVDLLNQLKGILTARYPLTTRRS